MRGQEEKILQHDEKYQKVFVVKMSRACYRVVYVIECKYLVSV